MSLSLSTHKHGPDITVVEIAGRITLGRDSGQIEAAILKILEAGVRKLVIDLAKVEYLDSTGIGKIAIAYGRITQAGAQARVSGAKGLVMDLFRITRLDTVIKFLPDIESACADLDGARQSPPMAAK
jgi:anti-sigma B factor antagonist